MTDETVGFERDILPLMRQIDIDHMRPFNVFLDDYGFMSKRENAIMVRDFLSGEKQPQMPPNGPFWTEAQLGTLSRWIETGCRP